MIHAGAYDPTLLQPKTENKIGGITATSNSITLPGLGKTISNAQYSITSGLMSITTTEPHGFYKGKYITLAGIAMTCYLSYTVSESVTTPGSGYSVSSTPLVTGAGSISGATGLKVKITSVSGSTVTGVDIDGEAKYALRNYANGDVILITGGGNGLAAITITKTEVSPKTYPTTDTSKFTNNLGGAADNTGYTVVKVSDANNFTVNVGVSTVETFYKTGGIAIGIRPNQYIRYSKGANDAVISSSGLEDKGIYQLRGDLIYDQGFGTGITTVRIKQIAGSNKTFSSNFDASTSLDKDHYFVTPVPFILPDTNINGQIGGGKNLYSAIKTNDQSGDCLLYTSPSPRDQRGSRMPASA